MVLPHTRSFLMDRASLLSHVDHWGRETSPNRARLPGLTTEEAALHRDLVEDSLGPSVRLEQERVRFSAIEVGLRSAPR